MEKVFESERIIFIRPEMDLIPDYLEMVNDIENVAKYISDRREPYTEQEEIDYIKDKIDNDAMMYSMIEKDTGKFIGNTSFFDIKGDQAEWGIVITADMQNKEYGKEALKRMMEYGFEEGGFRRIVLSVFADNARAVHVYEKCGFKVYDRNDVDVFMEFDRSDWEKDQ